MPQRKKDPMPDPVHEGWVYICCFLRPLKVDRRDYIHEDPTLEYPIRHYVGWTGQNTPTNRIKAHGIPINSLVALLPSSCLCEEQKIKLYGLCPRCNRGLFYFSDSPTYDPAFREIFESRQLATEDHVCKPAIETRGQIKAMMEVLHAPIHPASGLPIAFDQE